MDLLGVLEGLLFIVGDEGLTLEQMSSILEIDKDTAKDLLMRLKETYEDSKRGLRIRFLGNAFKLSTKEEHKPYYQKLFSSSESSSLSQSALEVLAIIAYNEPITRVEIDAYRGVSSDYVLRRLLAKGLVKEAGKSSMPGRPNLYKTTHEFLDYFGLATLDDLPKIDVSNDNTEEELFTSIYKEK